MIPQQYTYSEYGDKYSKKQDLTKKVANLGQITDTDEEPDTEVNEAEEPAPSVNKHAKTKKSYLANLGSS